MGYTTQFDGQLNFIKPLTAEEELELGNILQEDAREHPEWKLPEGCTYLSYIQFEITKDKTGIEWDQGEKFYSAEDAATLVIQVMQQKFPKFGLKGSLFAQGEEAGDIWILNIENNKGVRKEIPKPSDTISCPHCLGVFALGDVI